MSTTAASVLRTLITTIIEQSPSSDLPDTIAQSLWEQELALRNEGLPIEAGEIGVFARDAYDARTRRERVSRVA